MSSSAFMLPALPQPSTADFKGIDKMGPKSFKSTRPDGSADGDRDFLATLNRISDRKAPERRETPAVEKPVPACERTDQAPPDLEKINDTQDHRPDDGNTPDEFRSGTEFPIVKPMAPIWPADHFFLQFQMMAGMSNSSDNQSVSTSEVPMPVLMNLMEHAQLRGQELNTDWLAGFANFEQWPADISPQATNFYLVEHLSGTGIYHQTDGEAVGAQLKYFGLWHWMMSAPDNMAASPTAALAANSDGALTDLLPNRENVFTPINLGENTGNPGGQVTNVGEEAIKGIADFLSKLVNSPRTRESIVAENSNPTGTVKDNQIPFGASQGSNSEIRLEMPLPAETENSPQNKWYAALKTAEQPGHSLLSAQGATAKPVEEGASFKSTIMKGQLALTEPVDSKVVAAEGEAKDGSFLFAQDQMPEHLTRTAGAPRQSASAQSSFSAQAMNQIVQKAVLSLNNGQSEVQIDLKPEFLGHIRMQIVSEGQQVAIKIVAEFPFVKDMLESNLAQLKAELQAQGLDIDELEVSVAHDSNPQDDQNQKLAATSEGKSTDNDMTAEEDESAEQSQIGAVGSGESGETAIDYFA